MIYRDIWILGHCVQSSSMSITGRKECNRYKSIQTNSKRWWCYCKYRTVMGTKGKFEHICFEPIQCGELCKVGHFHVSIQILFKFQRNNSRLLQFKIVTSNDGIIQHLFNSNGTLVSIPNYKICCYKCFISKFISPKLLSTLAVWTLNFIHSSIMLKITKGELIRVCL